MGGCWAHGTCVALLAACSRLCYKTAAAVVHSAAHSPEPSMQHTRLLTPNPPPPSAPAASESIYGGTFEDENFSVRLGGAPFMLAVLSPGQDCCGSQFAVTCVRAFWLEGRAVGFGQVLAGHGVVREVQSAEVGEDGQVGGGGGGGGWHWLYCCGAVVLLAAS